MKRIFGYGVVLLLIIVLTAQTGLAFETKETAAPDLKQLEAAARQETPRPCTNWARAMKMGWVLYRITCKPMYGITSLFTRIYGSAQSAGCRCKENERRSISRGTETSP